MAPDGANQVPECSICLHQYNLEENLPCLLLPCGHGLCSACVGSVEACPECRMPVDQSMPNYGMRDMIAKLRADGLSSLNGTINGPSPLLLPSTPTIAFNNASSPTIHSLLSPRLVSPSITKGGPRPCSKHVGQMLEYFCPDDLSPCCKMCLVMEHHSHSKPKDLNPQALQQVLASTPQVAVEQAQRRISASEEAEHLVRRINTEADLLIKAVRSHQDQLLQKLLPSSMMAGDQSQRDAYLDVIQTEREELRLAAHTVSTRFAPTNQGTVTDFLLAMQLLRDRLQQETARGFPLETGAPLRYESLYFDQLHETIRRGWAEWRSVSGLHSNGFTDGHVSPLLSSYDNALGGSLWSYDNLTPHTHAHTPTPSPLSAFNLLTPQTLTPSTVASTPAATPTSPTPRVSVHLFTGGLLGPPPPSPPKTPAATLRLPTPINVFSSSSIMSSPTTDSPVDHKSHGNVSPMDSDAPVETHTRVCDKPSQQQQRPQMMQQPQLQKHTQHDWAPKKKMHHVGNGASNEPSLDQSPWYRGKVSRMLHELDGDVAVDLGDGSTPLAVYFNLLGGRVTTKNAEGFEPSQLSVGREVYVMLTDNPDHRRAHLDPSKRYVARAMKLGRPLPKPKMYRGTVCNIVSNDNKKGFIDVQMSDGKTVYKVFYSLINNGRMQTINMDDSVNPHHIRKGTALMVELMLNPEVDRRDNGSRKYVARAIKAVK